MRIIAFFLIGLLVACSEPETTGCRPLTQEEVDARIDDFMTEFRKSPDYPWIKINKGTLPDTSGIEDAYMKRIIQAILQEDFTEMENLKTSASQERIDQLIALWKDDFTQEATDGFVTILRDQRGDAVRLIMHKGLQSSDATIQAYALNSLMDFEDIWSIITDDDGMIDDEKVDQLVIEYGEAQSKQ